jgi:hypothetical protein
LGKDYKNEDYIKQFTIRVPENLAKIRRVDKFYHEKVADTPKALFQVLNQQRERLLGAKENFGDYISPESFEERKENDVDTGVRQPPIHSSKKRFIAPTSPQCP